MTKNYALIIGRFQVDKPHAGHEAILDYRGLGYENALIALGESPLTPSEAHPLTFDQRRDMLADWYLRLPNYPNILGLKFVKVYDRPSDDEWVIGLCRRILLALGADLLADSKVEVTPLVGKDSVFDTKFVTKNGSLNLLGYMTSALREWGVTVNDPHHIDVITHSTTDEGRVTGDHPPVGRSEGERRAIIWAMEHQSWSSCRNCNQLPDLNN